MSENTLQPAIIQEDEIDLKELFKTIWRGKWIILAITTLITIGSVLYTFSKPNIYESKTILVLANQKGGMSNLGGLGGLASLAGVNLPDSGSDSNAQLFELLIKDYEYNKFIIQKYDLLTKLGDQEKNYVFAANYDGMYRLLNGSKEQVQPNIDEQQMYNAYKALTGMISFESDKKTNTYTLKATTNDRYLAKVLVDIYLDETIAYIKTNDIKGVKEQLASYQEELYKATDISTRDSISKLIASLMEKKVLSQSNKLYTFKQLIEPQVPPVFDKVGPKRSLTVVVSAVTGFILSIFIVFILQFFQKEDKSNG